MIKISTTHNIFHGDQKDCTQVVSIYSCYGRYYIASFSICIVKAQKNVQIVAAI